MISSDGKSTNDVVGGKSERACDNCVRKKARWYCAADDAFLCQSCDSSVHSANPLARRHERVRLKIVHNGEPVPPSWHRGFTRKARTPRQKKHAAAEGVTVVSHSHSHSHPLRLVPEISGDEENEEQLLYRVPIFDPFVAELCSTSNEKGPGSGSKSVSGFGPSEMDLAEFAADVESLLGKGLEEEAFDMEGLGILDERERDSWECCFGSERERVKVEDEEENIDVYHQFIGLERETFELNFDCDSPIEEEEDDKEKTVAKMMNVEDNTEKDGSKIFLRLDYQGVMSAWDDHKSPWMTGKRPDFNSDDCWPHCMVCIRRFLT